MTINIQPLESYRIGRTQLPIPCPLCGGDNLFDAADCRVCLAPMALARTAVGDKKKRPPQLIVPIGADGVGKTIYLGMLLDLLNRERDRCVVKSCSAASVSIQQSVISALADGQFPDSTSDDPTDWKWAHLRLTQRSRRARLDVFMSDISGRGLLQEVDNPGKHNVIGPVLTKASGIFLIVDAARIAADNKDEEYFARQFVSHMIDLREIEFETNQHRQRQTTPKKRRKTMETPPKVDLPAVALVLMKADQCPECWQDPREFARRRMPALWAESKRLDQFEVFAASAVGAVGKMLTPSGRIQELPLRIEPRGIIEPFRWVVGQTMKQSHP